jgi:hypothetical protein
VVSDLDETIAEDTRVWIGRIEPGREAEHARFVEWLTGDEAKSIFRRRRLNEYRLIENDGTITVVFKAPHTGDPRLMIDFLRYPGVWPEFWQFVNSGRAEDVDPQAGAVKVHWRRADD